MKKLLIATTALVATAGMASADITISGHAAAGIYSGLDTKAASSAAYQGLKLASGGAASTSAATQTADGTLTLGTTTAAKAMAATATAGRICTQRPCLFEELPGQHLDTALQRI